MRTTFLAGTLAAAFAAMPVLTQAMAQQETALADTALIGLPVFSIDGMELGVVTEVGLDDGEPVLIADIQRPLGLGPTIVVIPSHMIVRKADRIKLKVTASQMRDALIGHHR